MNYFIKLLESIMKIRVYFGFVQKLGKPNLTAIKLCYNDTLLYAQNYINLSIGWFLKGAFSML